MGIPGGVGSMGDWGSHPGHGFDALQGGMWAGKGLCEERPLWTFGEGGDPVGTSLLWCHGAFVRMYGPRGQSFSPSERSCGALRMVESKQEAQSGYSFVPRSRGAGRSIVTHVGCIAPSQSTRIPLLACTWGGLPAKLHVDGVEAQRPPEGGVEDGEVGTEIVASVQVAPGLECLKIIHEGGLPHDCAYRVPDDWVGGAGLGEEDVADIEGAGEGVEVLVAGEVTAALCASVKGADGIGEFLHALAHGMGEAVASELGGVTGGNVQFTGPVNYGKILRPVNLKNISYILVICPRFTTVENCGNILNFLDNHLIFAKPVNVKFSASPNPGGNKTPHEHVVAFISFLQYKFRNGRLVMAISQPEGNEASADDWVMEL
ncbi:hypothetical protein FB451DRAFT_1368356 [Mycena latifolia]|nr:hypothetical protein FB451DRAFT_1368356 [Mycena latifolia]